MDQQQQQHQQQQQQKYYPSNMPGVFNDTDCECPACDDIKDALPKSMAEIEALKKENGKTARKES